MRTDTRLEWCLMATILVIVRAVGVHAHFLPQSFAPTP
jgi:hypothetical protein